MTQPARKERIIAAFAVTSIGVLLWFGVIVLAAWAQRSETWAAATVGICGTVFALMWAVVWTWATLQYWAEVWK